MDFGTILTPAAAEKREAFFRTIFGNLQGYLSVARKGSDGSWNEQFFLYPGQLGLASEAIHASIQSNNLYFCPQLFEQPKRRKDYSGPVSCLWADLDACDPIKLLVAPTVLIRSSGHRHQGFWLLEDLIDPFDAEELSRRIAYYHRNDGADVSGWDITQLLRIPYTLNFKYPDCPIVTIADLNKTRYRIEDFKEYPPTIKELGESQIPSDLPDPEIVLQKYQARLSDAVLYLYSNEPAKGHRSQDLWKLELLLAEAGLELKETFVVVEAAACNKYRADGRPKEDLWAEVKKAYAHVANQVEARKLRYQKTTDLSDAKEPPEESFVERYVAWAKDQTDASDSYHQASAFMVLSAVFSEILTIPTSYNPQGTRPNLWFMVLGDTTLTRKTTALNMGMDILEEVNDDAIVANESTIEGLLTAMAARTAKSSVFLRDEFSGMLEQMQRKDYYAGMAELLTKLYDGRPIKRVLARSTITVRYPILIMFTGGIRSRILELMTEDYIRSGFIPRFVFFSGTSDLTKYRPLGPPTELADSRRVSLVSELQEMRAKFEGQTGFGISLSGSAVSQPKVWTAELAKDAWERQQQVEMTLIENGTKARDPELFIPVYQRLSTSILKAATLIAASRTDNPTPNERIQVTAKDIEHAAFYGQMWQASALEVVSSAGTTAAEAQTRRILRYIVERSAHGAARHAITNTFKLTKKGADNILETLADRGLVRKVTQGSEVVYYPVEG